MDHLLEESVSNEDLKKFEARYHAEFNSGKVSSSAQFEYAWCLVRSKYPADIRKGILLLEDLYQVPNFRHLLDVLQKWLGLPKCIIEGLI